MQTIINHNSLINKLTNLYNIKYKPYSSSIYPDVLITKLKNNELIDELLMHIYSNLFKFNLEQIQYLLTVLDLESDIVQDMILIKYLDIINSYYFSYEFENYKICLLLDPYINLTYRQKDTILNFRNDRRDSIPFPIYKQIIETGGVFEESRNLTFPTDEILLDAILDNTSINYLRDIDISSIHTKFSVTSLPRDLSLSTTQTLIQKITEYTGPIYYIKSIAHIFLLYAIKTCKVDIVEWIIKIHYKSECNLEPIIQEIKNHYNNSYPINNDFKILKLLCENNNCSIMYNTSFVTDIQYFYIKNGLDNLNNNNELILIADYMIDIIENRNIIIPDQPNIEILYDFCSNFIFSKNCNNRDKYFKIILKLYKDKILNRMLINYTDHYMVNTIDYIINEEIMIEHINFDIIDIVIENCAEFSNYTLIILYVELIKACFNIFVKHVEECQDYIEDPRILESIKKIEKVCSPYDIDRFFKHSVIKLFTIISYNLEKLSEIQIAKTKYYNKYYGKFNKDTLDKLVERMLFDTIYKYRDINKYHPAIAYIIKRHNIHSLSYGEMNIWNFY